MSCAPVPRAGMVLLGLLSLDWRVNLPIMKVVIMEIPRWIFRGDSMLLASLGLFVMAWLSGQFLRVPARRRRQLLGVASCNRVGRTMLAIHGVSPPPLGRTAILGYTRPIWSVLLSVWF